MFSYLKFKLLKVSKLNSKYFQIYSISTNTEQEEGGNTSSLVELERFDVISLSSNHEQVFSADFCPHSFQKWIQYSARSRPLLVHVHHWNNRCKIRNNQTKRGTDDEVHNYWPKTLAILTNPFGCQRLNKRVVWGITICKVTLKFPKKMGFSSDLTHLEIRPTDCLKKKNPR